MRRSLAPAKGVPAMWMASPERAYAEMGSRMLTNPWWWVSLWQQSALNFWTAYGEEFERLQAERAPEEGSGD